MDPVTLIVTALTAGAAAGGQSVVTEAIKDAYTGLKALIKRKFAGKPSAEVALTEHENDPQTWQAPLKKALLQEHLDQDAEILQAAQALLDQLQAQPGGEQYTQSIIGNYNAQVQGSGSASVSVNHPKEP
jgi:hypothetical protein